MSRTLKHRRTARGPRGHSRRPTSRPAGQPAQPPLHNTWSVSSPRGSKNSGQVCIQQLWHTTGSSDRPRGQQSPCRGRPALLGRLQEQPQMSTRRWVQPQGAPRRLAWRTWQGWHAHASAAWPRPATGAQQHPHGPRALDRPTIALPATGPQVAPAQSQALRRQAEVWLCAGREGAHAARWGARRAASHASVGSRCRRCRRSRRRRRRRCRCRSECRRWCRGCRTSWTSGSLTSGCVRIAATVCCRACAPHHPRPRRHDVAQI